MIWEVTYHPLGDMKVRNTQVTGTDEFDARRNFHANYPKSKIKLIWPKDKNAVYQARQLDLQKQNTGKSEKTGTN